MVKLLSQHVLQCQFIKIQKIQGSNKTGGPEIGCTLEEGTNGTSPQLQTYNDSQDFGGTAGDMVGVGMQLHHKAFLLCLINLLSNLVKWVLIR